MDYTPRWIDAHSGPHYVVVPQDTSLEKLIAFMNHMYKHQHRRVEGVAGFELLHEDEPWETFFKSWATRD